jgi:hypothetical protein
LRQLERAINITNIQSESVLLEANKWQSERGCVLAAKSCAKGFTQITKKKTNGVA